MQWQGSKDVFGCQPNKGIPANQDSPKSQEGFGPGSFRSLNLRGMLKPYKIRNSTGAAIMVPRTRFIIVGCLGRLQSKRFERSGIDATDG